MPNDENNLVLDEDDMKTLLNYTVSYEDTQEHCNKYEDELAVGIVNPETKFQYAWCLTHCNNTANLKKACVLFEEIFKDGNEEMKRDSLFYLAVAETKQKNYCNAKKYIVAFLSVESTNVQAEQLKQYIEKQLKKDGVKGMALVGAAAIFGGATAVIVGTMVAGAAIGCILKKRYK